MAERIPEAKLRALREALAKDGSVTFQNGARIERVIRYKLTTPLGAVVIGTEEEAARLYELALRGPLPLPQPATQKMLDRAFGAKAPW